MCYYFLCSNNHHIWLDYWLRFWNKRFKISWKTKKCFLIYHSTIYQYVHNICNGFLLHNVPTIFCVMNLSKWIPKSIDTWSWNSRKHFKSCSYLLFNMLYYYYSTYYSTFTIFFIYVGGTHTTKPTECQIFQEPLTIISDEETFL